MSYLTVYTDDVLNTTNNETDFPELKGVYEEVFDIKVQERSILKYPNLRIYKSPFGFSVDNTDQITELVNECFLTEVFRNFDTTFRKKSTY